MKARTGWLDTLTDYQGQFPQTRQRGDRAMAVIGHPQRLATLLTTLFERGQYLLLRRFGTRTSASHLLAPISKDQLHHLSLHPLSTQVCHSAVFFLPGIGLLRHQGSVQLGDQ